MIFFSIIIPTYNRARFLPKAIESVLGQTYSNWELIIVDDGSTDNTREVVGNYNDECIKYIYQENAERSAARNNGIRHANGEYICFLDSDDFYPPDFLSILYGKSIKNKIDGFYLPAIEFINETGNSIRKLEPVPLADNMPLQIMKKGWVIPCIVCVHRSAFLTNMFDKRFSLWEDTHLWLRVLQHTPYIPVPDAKVFVVEHSSSTVFSGMEHVKISDVRRYMAAIEDLQQHSGLAEIIPKRHFIDYRLKKSELYWYQSRKNGQFYTALKIVAQMFGIKYNIRNLLLLLKTPLALLEK